MFFKDKLSGYRTIEFVNKTKNNTTSRNANENDEVRIEGYFKKGRRNGVCTITTNDVEIKGWYNKDGFLEGPGTVRYLKKGKYKLYVIFYALIKIILIK